MGEGRRAGGIGGRRAVEMGGRDGGEGLEGTLQRPLAKQLQTRTPCNGETDSKLAVVCLPVLMRYVFVCLYHSFIIGGVAIINHCC